MLVTRHGQMHSNASGTGSRRACCAFSAGGHRCSRLHIQRPLAASHHRMSQHRPIPCAAVAERPAPTAAPVPHPAGTAAPPAAAFDALSASTLRLALHAAWEVCYSSPDVLQGKTCLRQLLLGHWLLQSGDWREGEEGQLLLPLAEARQVVEQQLAAAVASGVKVHRHTLLSRFYPGGEQFSSAWRKNKFGKEVFSLDDQQRPQNVILRPDILLAKAHQVLGRTGPAARLPFAPPARLLQLLAQHPPWRSGLDVVYYLAGRQLLAPYVEGVKVKTVSGEMVIYMGPSWREWLGLAPRGKLHEVIDPSRTIKVMVPDEGKAVFVLDAAALQKDTREADAMMQALLVHTERVAAAAAKAAEGVLQPRTWYELRLSPSNTTGSSSSSSSTYDSTSLQPVQDGSWRAASQQTAVDDFLKLLPARLRPAVAPYLEPPRNQPQLLELVVEGRKGLKLYLSDGSCCRPLPTDMKVTVQEMLDALPATATTVNSSSSSSSSSSSCFSKQGHSDVPDAAGPGPSSSAAAATDDDDVEGGRKVSSSSSRSTFPGSLHRVSTTQDEHGTITAVTYRVGRHLPGLGRLIQDVLTDMAASLRQGTPHSMLLLGGAGSGRTTLLRDLARTMSDPVAAGGLRLDVMIMDTSNDVAGGGPEPHSCIGRARRVMVPSRQQQAEVMAEAVAAQRPQVVIIDEMGTQEEVAAALALAEQGVLLVAGVANNRLQAALRNPLLQPLLGGVETVTTTELKRDGQTKQTRRKVKVRSHRKGPAAVSLALELMSHNRWRLHADVEHDVDALLKGGLLSETPATSTRRGASKASIRRAMQAAEAIKRNLQEAKQLLLTQQRGFAEGGEVLVMFETAAAAADAQAAAEAAVAQ